MLTSSSSCNQSDSFSELLPFHCPSCNNKRFRSLIALRLHTSIVHDIPTPSVHTSQASAMKENDLLNSASLHVLTDSSKSSSIGQVSSCHDVSVDHVFDKYSSKIDEVFSKYDDQTKNLENKLKLTKQMEEIQKQKKELYRLSRAWKKSTGVSHLVHDRSLRSSNTLRNSWNDRLTKPEHIAATRQVLESRPDTKSDPNIAKQLDLSLQLAAQFKEKALDAEKKLEEKIREEEHMKQYLEATAAKEQEAKRKLAEMMEELLQRAERAEARLQTYEEPCHGREHTGDVMRSGSTARHVQDNKHVAKRSDHQSSQKSAYGMPTSQGIPPGKQNKRSSSNPHPSARSRGRSSTRDNLQPTMHPPYTSDTPFSNLIGRKSSTEASNRRVALFCVFTQLRSIDLLRCSLVCREWRDTSRHQQLWSRIRFHDVDVDRRLLRLVSNWSEKTCFFCLKNVGSLNHDHSSSGAGLLEEGLEMVLKACAGNLLVFSIDQCDPALTSRVLWMVSCYNKNVCSISYRSSLDPVSHQVAWALGSACRNIKSLEVAPLQPCSVRGLFTNNVARLLSWCWPHLQALSFGGLDVDGAGLLAVALNCHHLKVLELDHARGINQDHALTVCKHGLKELHTLLFTHTPILPSTLLHFLKSLNLKSVFVVVSQRDYFTRSKNKKVANDYVKISRGLMNIQRKSSFRHIVSVECN